MDGADRIKYQLYDDELIRNTHLEVVGTESKNNKKNNIFRKCYTCIIIVKTKDSMMYDNKIQIILILQYLHM